VRVIAYATNRAPFHSVEVSGIISGWASIRSGTSMTRSAPESVTLGLLSNTWTFFLLPNACDLMWTTVNLVCMNPSLRACPFLAGVPYAVSVRGEVAKAYRSD